MARGRQKAREGPRAWRGSEKQQVVPSSPPYLFPDRLTKAAWRLDGIHKHPPLFPPPFPPVRQSLEDEMVRGQVLRLVSLPLWQALSSGRLQLELHAHPQVS